MPIAHPKGEASSIFQASPPSLLPLHAPPRTDSSPPEMTRSQQKSFSLFLRAIFILRRVIGNIRTTFTQHSNILAELTSDNPWWNHLNLATKANNKINKKCYGNHQEWLNQRLKLKPFKLPRLQKYFQSKKPWHLRQPRAWTRMTFPARGNRWKVGKWSSFWKVSTQTTKTTQKDDLKNSCVAASSQTTSKFIHYLPEAPHSRYSSINAVKSPQGQYSKTRYQPSEAGPRNG